MINISIWTNTTLHVKFVSKNYNKLPTVSRTDLFSDFVSLQRKQLMTAISKDRASVMEREKPIINTNIDHPRPSISEAGATLASTPREPRRTAER